MPNCRTCGTHIGGGEGHSLKDGPNGECTWLCAECNEAQEAPVKSLVKPVLDAFSLGNRRGWEQCIESLGDFRGDGVVTDDMIAWLEKEKLEGSV